MFILKITYFAPFFKNMRYLEIAIGLDLSSKSFVLLSFCSVKCLQE